MMNWLRRQKNRITMVILAGFLAAAFVGFGDYVFRRSPLDAALEVNGEEIPYKRFEARRRDVLRQHRSDGAPPVDAAVKNQAVQSLVQETVLLQEARKYGIDVTDREVAAYVQSLPAFHRDGRFDQEAYFRTLGQVLGVTAQEFESDRRRELLIHKLQTLMISSVRISPAELDAALRDRLAKASPKEREEAAGKKDALKDELRQMEAQQVMREWYTQLGSRVKIKSHLDHWEGGKS